MTKTTQTSDLSHRTLILPAQGPVHFTAAHPAITMEAFQALPQDMFENITAKAILTKTTTSKAKKNTSPLPVDVAYDLFSRKWALSNGSSLPAVTGSAKAALQSALNEAADQLNLAMRAPLTTHSAVAVASPDYAQALEAPRSLAAPGQDLRSWRRADNVALERRQEIPQESADRDVLDQTIERLALLDRPVPVTFDVPVQPDETPLRINVLFSAEINHAIPQVDRSDLTLEIALDKSLDGDIVARRYAASTCLAFAQTLQLYTGWLERTVHFTCLISDPEVSLGTRLLLEVRLHNEAWTQGLHRVGGNTIDDLLSENFPGIDFLRAGR
jgi:hypothetical protein